LLQEVGAAFAASARGQRTKGNVMGKGFRRWFADDRAIDLVEYALLATFIAIVGLLGFQAIGINMNTSYTSWDSAVDSIWEVPPPTSTP
jgi:Flp pilus assembly pilin Flp